MFTRISELQFSVSNPTVTINGVRFIRAGGDQIAFSNAETTGTLSLTTTGLLNLSDLWETATALDWANYIDDNNVVGILATSTSDEVQVYADGAVSPLATLASGQAFVLGVLPNEFSAFYLDNTEAAVASLPYYKFCASNEPAYMTGFFTTITGVKVGSGFSYTIPDTSVVDFDDIYGGSIPTGAVGARIFVTAPCRWSIEEGSDTNPMTSTNKVNFPQITPEQGLITFGKT